MTAHLTARTRLAGLRPARRAYLVTAALAGLCCAIGVGVAFAYFMTSDSSSYGAATADKINAGPIPTLTSVAGRDVTIAWGAGKTTAGQGVTGYSVSRYAASSGGSPIAPSANCAGAALSSPCTENNLPAGTWYYAVAGHIDTWAGPDSTTRLAIIVGAPVLTLTTTAFTSQHAGQTTSATITNYLDNEVVTYCLDGSGTYPCTGTTLGSDVTVPASSGTQTSTLSIPTALSAGPHTIYALGHSGSIASKPITVNPDPATITSFTATPSTVAYGNEATVSFAVTVTPTYGSVPNGDTVAITQGATALCTVTLASGSGTCSPTNNVLPFAASAYTVTATFGDQNFTTPAATTSLTVSKAVVTITASNGAMTYGGTPPSITASYTGFAPGEDHTNLSSQPICVSAATSSSHVSGSPYTSSCSGAAAANYTINYVAGTVTINKAPLTITASSGTMAYGGTPPTVTASYTGFVNSDTAANLSSQPNCVPGASSTSSVAGSPYTSSCSGAVDGDYTITYATGNVTVTKAVLTVTGDPQSRAYGDANPTLTYTMTGFKNTETQAGATTGSPNLSTTAGAASTVGPYAITVTAGTLAAANYTFTTVNGTLTVTKAVLTVTADPKSKSYGAALPAFTYVMAGFKNGETQATATTGQPSLAANATASSNVGSYTITPAIGTLASNNYSFSFVTNTLAINPVALQITASGGTMTYGGTPPTITASYTGFVNSDTSTSLTSQPNCVPGATSSSSVAGSPYTSSCTGAVDVNYTISYVAGSVTVTKAPLTITASSGSMTAGGTPPTITAAYTGFVNGQDHNALSSQPSCSTTATSSSTAGSYPSSCSGAAAANYAISYVNGSVTVNAGPLDHFTVANPGTQTAGTQFSVTVSALDINGDPANGWTSTTNCVTFSGAASSPGPVTAPLYPVPGGSCTTPQSGLSFNSSGQATAAMTLYKASGTTNLTATSVSPAGKTGASGNFAVNSGGANLSFSSAPPTLSGNHATWTSTVAIANDAWGNAPLYAGAGITITLTLADGSHFSVIAGATGNANTQTTATVAATGSPSGQFTVEHIDSAGSKSTTLTASTTTTGFTTSNNKSITITS